MRVVHLAGAASFQDPESSQVYTAGDDGVFQLPHPVGVQLTTNHASMFREESAHLAAERAAKLEELGNPHAVRGIVANLLERADKAEARLAAIEEHLGISQPHEFDGLLATLEGVEPEVATEVSPAPVAPEKPTRARKAAAAKTAPSQRKATAKPTGKRTSAKPKTQAAAEVATEETPDDSASLEGDAPQDSDASDE